MGWSFFATIGFPFDRFILHSKNYGKSRFGQDCSKVCSQRAFDQSRGSLQTHGFLLKSRIDMWGASEGLRGTLGSSSMEFLWYVLWEIKVWAGSLQSLLPVLRSVRGLGLRTEPPGGTQCAQDEQHCEGSAPQLGVRSRQSLALGVCIIEPLTPRI